MLRPFAPPDAEPITLVRAKLHCRIEHDLDDDLVAVFIGTARRLVEAEQRRALVTQTWDLLLDAFPCGPIVVPRPPLRGVTSVSYRDAEGEATTLDPGDYEVIAGLPDQPGRILPARGKSWPSARPFPGSVAVRFVAGYGDPEDVPASTVAAMLLIVGHLYRNRDDGVEGHTLDDFPGAVRTLIAAESWGAYP